MYIWLSAYHQDKAIAIKRPMGHIVHRSYPYTSTIIKGLFVTKASVCHLHLPPPPNKKQIKYLLNYKVYLMGHMTVLISSSPLKFFMKNMIILS